MTELDHAAGYARWAPHYPPCAHNELMRVEEAAVLSLLPALAGSFALDAACGTGRYLRQLLAHGAQRVSGVDASSAMAVRVCSRVVALGDLRALPFESNRFDVVVCGLALNDLPSIDGAITEFARVTKAGGVVVCSLLHPRGARDHWTRTFAADGRTWSLPAFWHSRPAFDRACVAAGMRIDAVREPALDDSQGPVALVIRSVKA